MKKINNIKKEFPVLHRKIDGKRIIYLDNACSALKSNAVIEAVLDYYTKLGGCGGSRSGHVLSEKLEEKMEEARDLVRRFINAENKDDVIFTSGFTESANLVAECFPFSGNKNEIIVSDLEHNSNLLPFFEIAKKKKLIFKIFKTEKDGTFNLDKFKKFISSKTALVAISHSSNVVGGVLPIRQISEAVHGVGAKIFVDDAQYLSSHKEDVILNKIDLMAFSAHKIGGPPGIGVLYGGSELLKKLSRYKVGGGTVGKLFFKKDALMVDYLEVPHKFEAGIQNYPGILGLAAAIKFLNDFGIDNARYYVADLVRHAINSLVEIPQVKILGNIDNLDDGSLVSFIFYNDKYSASDFNIYLNSDLPGKIIAVRVGEQCANVLYKSKKIPKSVRISFFVYNTKKDIDDFIDALKKYIG